MLGALSGHNDPQVLIGFCSFDPAAELGSVDAMIAYYDFLEMTLTPSKARA